MAESKQEHTPGPWALYDDGIGEDCTPEEPGKRWLSIRTVEDDGSAGDEVAVIVNRTGEPTTEQYANGSLLASAPALLAFVEKWKGIIDGGAKGAEGWSREFDDEARSALASARGEGA